MAPLNINPCCFCGDPLIKHEEKNACNDGKTTFHCAKSQQSCTCKVSHSFIVADVFSYLVRVTIHSADCCIYKENEETRFHDIGGNHCFYEHVCQLHVNRICCENNCICDE